MGASGIVAQVILIRELLVSFLGNELTLGIILANWLILEAVGSFYFGKTVEKVKKKLEVYVFLQLFFSVSLPFSIYLCRGFKNFLITPGEGLGFAPVLFSSFLILLPVALSHGTLFTYGCKLYSQYETREATSIGKVYIFETIGSILGGLLITFILIRYFHSFDIAFFISLTNALACTLLLWPSTGKILKLQNLPLFLSVFSVILFTCLLFTPLSTRIHHASLQEQWRGLNVIHNENSIYGNITVTRSGEQYTFFSDGIPSVTTPVPDIALIEDQVHFPMLFHENPDYILVLSGGAGGRLHELLKYPVSRIDYVELDPLLLRLTHRFPTAMTQAELSDPRVRVHYTDGRFFVKRTSHRYDLIFIGLSAPQELQTNRLFSTEFFAIARKKMNPDGIIVLSLPGSMTYISPELRDLNRCIMDTLKNTFRFLRVIPGDTNLYFASDSEKLMKATPGEMVARLEARKIATHLMTLSYIEYRLHQRWQDWFFESMEKKTVHINSDFQPLAVFFSLSYWNALFSPYLTKLFKLFEGLSFKLVLVVLGLLTVLGSGLFLIKPHLARQAIPWAISTSGFTDIILDLTIILTFQTLYGYLYYQIGLLITIFMAGIAAGSFFITRRLEQLKNDNSIFLRAETSFILFSFLLPFVLMAQSHHLEKPVIYFLLYITFLILSFICGVLVGIEFPLATKIHLKTRNGEQKLGHTAGLIYGADLVGGFFGGLLGGVVLFPVLGLKETCFLVGLLKASSLVLFFIFTKTRK